MDKAPEAFRTISEVSEDLDVPKHVLRFWESRFSQLRPMKRGGGRRYYRPEDIALLRGIRRLLYEDGYTIRGVKKLLRERGVEFVKFQLGDEGSLQADPGFPDLAGETRDLASQGLAMRLAEFAASTPEAEDEESEEPTEPTELSNGAVARIRAALKDLEDCRETLLRSVSP